MTGFYCSLLFCSWPAYRHCMLRDFCSKRPFFSSSVLLIIVNVGLTAGEQVLPAFISLSLQRLL